MKHILGQRLAELRKTYSIDMEMLAQRSGISLGLITKIEDEGYLPDLAVLVKLARALGVRLGTLLDDHEEQGAVITRTGQAPNAIRFIAGTDGTPGAPKEQAAGTRTCLDFKALAIGKSSRNMEPFIIDVTPGVEQEKFDHEGEEFLYVLEGSLKLEYGSTSETLNAGDSVYYDSIVPHRITCAGSDPARLLAVVYTPV